ncbi:MAG: aminotransferase class IV [Ekhidna sp.]|uniref:aminotransferase class IV n=1 Tax=Ekhidna sp. TaxID=2608089 RepID=UPI0032EC0DB1
MPYCYFDGALLEESKAHISIHNLGLQRGFGIFDLFRGRSGKPVFMEDHLDRFDRSQAFLGLDRIISKEEIRDAVNGLQEWNGFRESAYRLMLLGDGSEAEARLKPLFYITQTDLSLHTNPDSAGVILYEYVREYPTIKSINYLTSNHLHRRKMEASAVDVIYHSNGLISEASRSNVFIVKDGAVKTPGENILEGITRKHVLSFCGEIAPCEVGDVTLDEFLEADEIFISSTLKEILPIVSVDRNRVGDGRTGAITDQIRERFLDYLHQ